MAVGTQTVAIVLQFAHYAADGAGAHGCSSVVAPTRAIAVGFNQRQGLSEVVKSFEPHEDAGCYVAAEIFAFGSYHIVCDGSAHVYNQGGALGRYDCGTNSRRNSVGAEGVISVASNVIPREMSDMVRLAMAGDFLKARELHRKYYPLFHNLFIDTNPVMVKEALWLMGRIERVFRLPLCETTEKNLETMRATLAKVGLV